LSRRRSLPGLGHNLARGRREAIQASQRGPRLQTGVADGRLGTGAKAAAGTREGTSGKHSGTASRQWALATAAGPQELARLAKPPGPGPAPTGRGLCPGPLPAWGPAGRG
jgi:hypothetical protein